ncbi:hypothetical protein [Marinobacterium arenosum]|nr:hypothetical protein [Marinobacterium arenosum]
MVDTFKLRLLFCIDTALVTGCPAGALLRVAFEWPRDQAAP